MRRKISDSSARNDYLCFVSLAWNLNKRNDMKYWTQIYYPSELKNTTIEFWRQRQAWYMFKKNNPDVSFENYIKLYTRTIQRGIRHKNCKQYILQNTCETLRFKTLMEITYFLGTSPATVRKMLNEGYEYRSYTLDVIEA